MVYDLFPRSRIDFEKYLDEEIGKSSVYVARVKLNPCRLEGVSERDVP